LKARSAFELERFKRWGYKRLVLDTIYPNAEYQDTALIHRYRGGLGDLLTTRPGIENLVCKGWPNVVVAVPSCYHFIFRGIPKVVLIDYFSLFAGLDGKATVYYFSVRKKYKLAIDLFCPAGFHENMTNWRITKSRLRSFCDLLEGPPFAPKLNLKLPSKTDLKSLLHLPNAPIVGMQIISERTEKDWPLKRYEELCHKLLANGIVPVTFHQKKKIRAIPHITGASLEEVASLISEVDLFIGPDSGLLHLAAALGKPTIWLFGPTNGRLTLEFYPTARMIQYPGQNGCHSPCYYNEIYNKFNCHGRYGDCMLRISVGEVFRNILEVLNR